METSDGVERALVPAAFDLDVARVGRTLLSDAFDFDLDFDVDFDFDREGPRFTQCPKKRLK